MLLLLCRSGSDLWAQTKVFATTLQRTETNKQTTFSLIWLGNWYANHLIILLYHGHFGNHNNSSVRTVPTAHDDTIPGE